MAKVSKTKKRIKPLTNKAGEVREITMADLKRARPAKDVLPDVVKLMARESEKRQRGRPKAVAPREVLAVRLDAGLAALIKKVGPGYSARVEAVLAKAALDGAFGRGGGARK